MWPTRSYDDGLQNQLNCKLNSLIAGSYVAQQVYQGTLSQSMYQIKYWGFQYEIANNPAESLVALQNTIAWANNSFNIIQTAPEGSPKYSLMPAAVQVGQLHLAFLREQYLYRMNFQNASTGLRDCTIGGVAVTPTECAVQYTNQYGKDLQVAYDTYYDYFETTYPAWKAWRRSQFTCQKSSQTKYQWVLGDALTNRGSVGDVGAWYRFKGPQIRNLICDATIDLRMNITANYMIGLLDPAHYFHQYVPWMSQAPSSCDSCLNTCFNSPQCFRNTPTDQQPSCTQSFGEFGR